MRNTPKTILAFLLSAQGLDVLAQPKEGFVKEEARDMIALCNSFSFIQQHGSDEDILPSSYEKEYTSGVFGLDNKYQIYRKGEVGVINLRGSTDKKSSWLENIYSAMIPAKGTIKISGEKVDYCFAKDPAAAVHSGYALGIAFLSKDILYHIKEMNENGVYDFIITGHSQGGALANMLRAYLENLPVAALSAKNNFKTYAFAAPMVGNKKFAEEYNSRFGLDKSSFNIVNPADPIPSFPLSYNDSSGLQSQLKSFVNENQSFSLKNALSSEMASLFEDGISDAVKMFGTRVSTQIEKKVGRVELPAYVEDINYHKLNNLIELTEFGDPEVSAKNSAPVSYKRTAGGAAAHEEKEPWGYQHKPYNYYTAVVKQYFPAELSAMKK